MTRRIDLKSLSLVQAIVEEGSLTAAAKRLHVSQPALSRRLNTLEERLAMPLFERSGRRLLPTAAGRRLIEAAGDLLPRADRIEQSLRALASGREGECRITTQCYTAYHWLPQRIAEVQESTPAAQYEVNTDATQSPLSALLEGEVDLAFVFEQEAPEGVTFMPLFKDEMMAIMPLGHPLAERKIVLPEDFRDQHFIVYSAPISGVLNQFLKPAGIKPARVSSVQVTDGILQMVRASLGITALAPWVIPPSLRKAFVLRPLGQRGIHRQWNAAFRATDKNPVTRRLIDSVKLQPPA